MYTITSKQQEGSTCKDSYPKCFITTSFDKYHREGAINPGEILNACFRHFPLFFHLNFCTSIHPIRMLYLIRLLYPVNYWDCYSLGQGSFYIREITILISNLNC